MKLSDVHELTEHDPCPGIASGFFSETKEMVERGARNFWKRKGYPHGKPPAEFNACNGIEELDIQAYNAARGF